MLLLRGNFCSRRIPLTSDAGGATEVSSVVSQNEGGSSLTSLAQAMEPNPTKASWERHINWQAIRNLQYAVQMVSSAARLKS